MGQHRRDGIRVGLEFNYVIETSHYIFCLHVFYHCQYLLAIPVIECIQDYKQLTVLICFPVEKRSMIHQ